MKRFQLVVLTMIGMIANAQNDALFTFEASYIGDNFYNYNGGMKTGYTYLGIADLNLGFNTENADLWNGGEFLIHVSNTHGGEPTGDFVGDFQGVSNIEAGNHTFLYELWYKHQMKNLGLIVGLQDLNAEFAVSDYAGLFLNGSFGIPSVIGDNTAAPIFPVTGLGVTFIYSINDRFTLKTSLYDGYINDFDSNTSNLRWKLCKEEGFTSYSEFQVAASPLNNRDGIYSFGYFIDQIINDNTSGAEKESGQGCYFVADQELIKSDNRILGAFAQVSYSPPKDGNNYLYLGYGLVYRGLFNKADNEIGIAVASASIDEGGYESSIEFTCKCAISDAVFVQPGFQYVSNPGGETSGLDNAMLGIVRFGLSF